MPLAIEVGLGPGNFVLDGDPAPPPKKRGTASNFWAMSTVAKRLPISATAEHLLLLLHVRFELDVKRCD